MLLSSDDEQSCCLASQVYTPLSEHPRFSHTLHSVNATFALALSSQVSFRLHGLLLSCEVKVLHVCYTYLIKVTPQKCCTCTAMIRVHTFFLHATTCACVNVHVRLHVIL